MGGVGGGRPRGQLEALCAGTWCSAQQALDRACIGEGWEGLLGDLARGKGHEEGARGQSFFIGTGDPPRGAES